MGCMRETSRGMEFNMVNSRRAKLYSLLLGIREREGPKNNVSPLF